MSEWINEHTAQGLTVLGFMLASLFGGWRLFKAQTPDTTIKNAATNDMLLGRLNNLQQTLESGIRQMERSDKVRDDDAERVKRDVITNLALTQTILALLQAERDR